VGRAARRQHQSLAAASLRPCPDPPQELARNPQLDEFFVRNLNEQPDGWAASDQSFDAVVCCVR
jgi:hypothetical protein